MPARVWGRRRSNARRAIQEQAGERAVGSEEGRSISWWWTTWKTADGQLNAFPPAEARARACSMAHSATTCFKFRAEAIHGAI